MAVPVISFAAVDELVTALKAGGVRSCSTNPAELNLPGVLVELAGVSFELLDGAILTTRVTLIAPSVGITQVHALLAEMLSQVAAVIDPDDGTVTATTRALGEQSTPMPALQLTHSIPINPESE